MDVTIDVHKVSALQGSKQPLTEIRFNSIAFSQIVVQSPRHHTDMCELLAMSCAQPDQLDFSLRVLASHGCAAGNTHDGWGVAFFQGNDAALFREPESATESDLARHLESHGPQASIAIAHIRRATRIARSLSNTQPFLRELGGRTHVFAHNGDLPGLSNHERFRLGAFRPVGGL